MKGHCGKLFPILSPGRVHCFCIPCGVCLKCYHPEVNLQFGGTTGGEGTVCYKCHHFKKAERPVKFKKRTCAAWLQLWNLSYDKDEEVGACHFGDGFIENIETSWWPKRTVRPGLTSWKQERSYYRLQPVKCSILRRQPCPLIVEEQNGTSSMCW